MNKAHKHAELMALYAKDAMETEKPWERWEYLSFDCKIWRALADHPRWNQTGTYRRKRITIKVNGVDVVAPEKEPLVGQTDYYVPCISNSSGYLPYNWKGDLVSMMHLEKGMVFKKSLDATQMAYALRMSLARSLS